MPGQRSPLALNRIELFAAVIAPIAVLLGFYYSLQFTGPYFPELGEPSWFVQGWQHIFSVFALPLVIMTSISTIALARCIMRRNDPQISPFGYFVMAWPLITVLFWFHPLIYFGSPILWSISGLILAVIIGSIRLAKTKLYYGDLLAIPLNTAWVILSYVYFIEWLEVFIW